jgi:hypothetical protein
VLRVVDEADADTFERLRPADERDVPVGDFGGGIVDLDCHGASSKKSDEKK